MTSTKLQTHHPLPAPAILSVPHSKSHVLAGVQDAYWSDEEAGPRLSLFSLEDQECPLCLEEMDISDLNFKPCVCGYQICRFCWHHIKENLNKRCPACRRVYTDEGVEFKPVATQDHKRLTQQKKQRDREKKELEVLGRKHLANVRVVQRNVVYVVGIGPRFAKEELIPTLRSNEYFGQYGKISKILIVKRTPPNGTGPVVGLYITYNRREDAARAIVAVDGAPSPGGGREVMRASYGTTKYCMAFLRNVTCNDHNCMNLHEWGDEKDCFTKEDLSTLKHTMKAAETRAKTTVLTKKEGEDATLPRAASWGQKSSTPAPSSSNHPLPTSPLVRQTRRNPTPRQARTAIGSSQVAVSEPKSTPVRGSADRKITSASSVSASRPSTPGVSASSVRTPASVVAELKTNRPKKDKEPAARDTSSPAPSLATESDTGSGPPEPPSSIPPADSASTNSPVPATASVPTIQPVPAVPPGLAAPPGIPSPSRPPRHATESPQTPLLASQSAYRMTSTAKQLLDEITFRDTVAPSSIISPFPEFDRTLQTLSADDGGFKFNLDPKLADEVENTDILPELEMDANTPFHGSYVDAFPALRSGSHLAAPPGLGYPRSSSRSIFDPVPNRLGVSSVTADKLSNYMGSFNPFSDAPEGSASSSPSLPSPSLPFDEERKVSRFGFARGRQSSSLASSPLNGPSHVPLGEMNGLHGSGDDHSPPGPPPGLSQLRWESQSHEYGNSQPPSIVNSPHIPSQMAYAPQSRFQPFDSVSEAQLREFIQASQEREYQKQISDAHAGYKPSPHFSDPAIMSAGYAPPSREIAFNSMAYGPPPGLGMMPMGSQSMAPHSSGIPAVPDANPAVTTSMPSPALSLSAADFPALVPSAPKEDQSPTKASASLLPNKSQDRSLRKAAKKAAAAEKSAEKQKGPTDKPGASKAKTLQVRVDTKDAKEASSPTTASEVASPILPVTASKVPSTSKPQSSVNKGKSEAKRPEAIEVQKEAKLHRKEDTTSKEKPKDKRLDNPSNSTSSKQAPRPAKSQPPPSTPLPEPQPVAQVPILSKKPKKSKPQAKQPKVVKEDDPGADSHRNIQPTEASGASTTATTPKVRSPSKSPDRRNRLSTEELLEEISRVHPGMDLVNHPFFDLQRLSSTAKMPLEYGPLVHALSALSVGGGSFANNVPSGSIDTAVSSFQQLLETLTQTISDLLRLLPRTTWDDSSSFDGVLRDMLKGDDFLDENGEDGQGKEDEVAALTLALERRARWMEVQLSKLEELHRDINTAAVKAVLTFNDNGWDKHGFLPQLGNSLKRFEGIGLKSEDGELRPMTSDELEKKLAVAKEVAMFAEAEAKEAMTKLQYVKEFDSDLY